MLNIELEEEKIEKIIDFINYYETHHLDTILYMNKIWNEYIQTKEEIITAFDIMIMYYKDILNNKIRNKLEIFEQPKLPYHLSYEEMDRYKQEEKYIKSNTNITPPSVKIKKGSRYIPCRNNKNEVGLYDNELRTFIKCPDINGFETVAI